MEGSEEGIVEGSPDGADKSSDRGIDEGSPNGSDVGSDECSKEEANFVLAFGLLVGWVANLLFGRKGCSGGVRACLEVGVCPVSKVAWMG